MGNFKHQSIRSTDRGDREREGDRERDRDMRDKEGQDKLRHVCGYHFPLSVATYH